MTIRARLVLMAAAPVILSVAATVGALLFQQGQLDDQVNLSVREQAASEAGKIAQSVYRLCAATDARNQSRLAHRNGPWAD